MTDRARRQEEPPDHIAAARLLTAVVESSGDAIISLSLDGVIQSWNAAAERLFGYRSAQAVGRPIDMLIPADRPWEERRISERLRAGERIGRFETMRVRSDGRLIPVAVTVSPIRDDADRVVGASEIVRDEAERREAQRALRESEERFRTLVEQVEDYAIFGIDPEGRATTWNEGVARVLGYDESEFLGQDIAPLIFTPEDVAAGVPQDEMETAAATGKSGNDRWMRRKDGTRFFAMGVTTGLRDDSGRLLGFTKVMRDQSERKLMEEALHESEVRFRRMFETAKDGIGDVTVRSRLERQTKEQAAALSELHRRKDEFLAMLSHELRNPLAPIANAVELLRLEARSESAVEQQARAIIERQVAQLRHLVDDLLEVSRITLGGIQLRHEPVAAADVVERAVEATRGLVDQRRHRLTVTVPPEPVWLSGDAARLEQVMVNLLTNAVKYTERDGRIWLSLHCEGEQAVLRVRDTGIGIAPDLLPYVFDLFTQAERSLDRSEGGLGIGLSLVQRIVELHGGTVEVRSSPGHGSDFEVRLPLMRRTSPTPPEQSAQGAQPAGRRLRVLVVDDNVDAAETLALLLQSRGHDIRTAHDGQSALEAVLDYRPDVVLLDIGLPGIDGLEVARRIRQEPALRHVLLVAMTGYGQEEAKQRSLEAGFTHHLVKPADFAQLQSILATIDGDPAPHSPV